MQHEESINCLLRVGLNLNGGLLASSSGGGNLLIAHTKASTLKIIAKSRFPHHHGAIFR